MLASGAFAKKSLRTKIMVSMLLAGLVPLLIAAAVMNWRSSVALEQQTFSQLESVKVAKKYEVEHYFAQIDNIIKFMAKDLTVVDAMKAFKESFSYLHLGDTDIREDKAALKKFYEQQFNQKLITETGTGTDVHQLIPTDLNGIAAQALYIARNENPLGSKHKLMRAGDASSYSDDHDRYHPVFTDLMEKFGFYDVFLVEPENGTIVYSVYKELDFATSLFNGPYSNTNFADAVKAATTLKPGEAVLKDFKDYLPSYNAPASFIAAPVFDKQNLEGVLVFQMPIDEINEVVQQSEGMGETGEVFLVGADGYMRSQSRFTEENTILRRQVTGDSLESLSNASSVSGYFENYDGKEAQGTYARLNIPGLDWSIAVEIEADEAHAAVHDMQFINGGLVVLTSLLIAVGASLFSSRTSKRIRNSVSVANAIANGEFGSKIDTRSGDEIQDLNKAMNRMQTELFGQMREKEVSMNRIKVALDNANANVMVADQDNVIIYMNKALEKTLRDVEQNLRSELPNFRVDGIVGKSIDEFHKNPAHQRGMLANLKTPHSAEIKAGGAELALAIVPIFDDAGERVGTVTEWRDQTAQRRTERDLESLIRSASQGDLSRRLELSRYQGFYQTLAQGLNDTMDAVEQPIIETRRVMEAVASGDLTARFSGEYRGEFKLLEQAVNESTGRLAEIITQLSGAVASLLDLSKSLARGNSDLHDRTNGQAGSIQETAAAMEEITGTVQHNTDNAHHANQLTRKAVEQAQEGNQVVHSAIKSIHQVNESSEEIATITDLINEIAFQTNLLALNAAVEAARAGEQGRGFAVVASEVRALAGRSAEAAKQIEVLVKESIGRIARGTEQVNRTGEALENIVDSIGQVSQIVSEIASASEEQTIGIGEINRAITQLESATQNNLDLVGEIANMSQSLGEQSVEINQAIGAFSVGAGSYTGRSGKSRWSQESRDEMFV